MRSIVQGFSCALAAVVSLCGSGALATNLPPGGTLNPVSGAPFISGTTERTGTVNFALHYFQFTPQPRSFDTTGHVFYRVIRHADNTLTFAYTVTDDDTSDTVISYFSTTGFAGFTTDVNYLTGFIVFGDPPDSAHRSNDGGTITFNYDVGFIQTARTVWIKTNATAYALTGQATISMFPNGNGSGTIGRIPRPVIDGTPPNVSITAPAAFADTCNPVTITGTANDPGGFSDYTLEYSSGANGPWTQITNSESPVTNSTLGTWTTSALPQGWYFLRLNAANTSGLTAVATTVVYVDRQFDTVDVRSPQTGNILGGSVCFDGTVSDGNGGVAFYRIDYAPLPAGAPFAAVNPASPTYPNGVVNDPMGSWNTASGPTAVPDGNYRVRVMGTDTCGFTLAVTKDLIIDNTAPIAHIDSPLSCGNVGGVVQVTGAVSDAHLSGWALQYAGGDAHGWVTIASGNANINGVLANWDTSRLRPCAYALRLLASDAAGVNCGSTTHQVEFVTLVSVGGSCAIDFNSDGFVNPDDLADYITAFFTGLCP